MDVQGIENKEIKDIIAEYLEENEQGVVKICPSVIFIPGLHMNSP